MKFYIIGNGFDLHYGLKTQYYHFKEFLSNINHEIVEKIDDLFDRYGCCIQDEEKTWSDFESNLVVFTQLDPDEIYSEVFENSEYDIEKSAYWTDPLFNADYYTEYINLLHENFNQWINSIETKITNDNIFSFNKNDFFLIFNYTDTIEKNFKISSRQVLHIHGKQGAKILVGHNCNSKPDLLKITKNKDSDYRDISASEKINTILKNSAKLYYKNSESIIKKYKNKFNSIKNYEEVVFIGFSCGEEDELYVREVFKYAKKITFYYHTEKDINNFTKLAKKHMFKYFNIIKW